MLFKDKDLRFLFYLGLGVFVFTGLIWEPVLKASGKSEQNSVVVQDIVQNAEQNHYQATTSETKEINAPQITSNNPVLITQEYGYTSFSAAHGGIRDNWHNGIDISADHGSPILSANNGRVVYIGDQDNYCPGKGYGKYVLVDGIDGYTLLYAHLSEITVKDGEKINKGEMIGRIGETGLATGPHLHFSVFETSKARMTLNGSCGPRPEGGEIDPMDYLDIS